MAGQPRLPGRRPRTKSIMGWIETSLSDLVDELAARKDVSRSWIVRRALVEYFEREAAE